MAGRHLARLTALALATALAPATFAPPAHAGAREEYVAGLIALKEQDAMRAIVHLSAAIDTQDLPPQLLSDAFYFRARALSRAERGDMALADLTRALTYWPENVKALRLRCRTQTLAGDTEQAEKDCNMAVLLAPDDWRTWFTRALMHDRDNNRTAARGDLVAAQSRMPKGTEDQPGVRGPLADYGLVAPEAPPVKVPEPASGD